MLCMSYAFILITTTSFSSGRPRMCMCIENFSVLRSKYDTNFFNACLLHGAESFLRS